MTCVFPSLLGVFGLQRLFQATSLMINLNPSYVAVMIMTTPVVVSFYNYFVGFEDKSNRIAGFGILLCAAGIALLKL